MADVSGALRTLDQWSGRVFDRATDIVLRQTEVAAPHDKGKLESSHSVAIGRRGPALYTASIQATAYYASFVDRGTRSHPIRAKNPDEQWLVFYWPKRGRVVSYPEVYHPGTKPANWFSKPMPQRWARAVATAAAST